MRSTSCAAAVTIERKAVIFLSWFLVFGSPSPHSSKWGLCWQHQLGDGGTTPGSSAALTLEARTALNPLSWLIFDNVLTIKDDCPLGFYHVNKNHYTNTSLDRERNQSNMSNLASKLTNFYKIYFWIIFFWGGDQSLLKFFSLGKVIAAQVNTTRKHQM